MTAVPLVPDIRVEYSVFEVPVTDFISLLSHVSSAQASQKFVTALPR
jgi:hypothetical protein